MSIKQTRNGLLEAGIAVTIFVNVDGKPKPFRLGETLGVLKPGTEVTIGIRVLKGGRMPLIIHASATAGGGEGSLTVLKPHSTKVLDEDHAYFMWRVPMIGDGAKGYTEWPANRLYALVEPEEGTFDLYRLGVITQDDRSGKTFVSKAWSEPPIQAEMYRDFQSGNLIFGNLSAGLLWRATIDQLDKSGRFNHLDIHDYVAPEEKTAPQELVGQKPGTGVVKWYSPFHGLGYAYFVNAAGDIEEGRIRFAHVPFNEDDVRTITDGAWFFAKKITDGATSKGADAGILKPELENIKLIDAPVPVTA